MYATAGLSPADIEAKVLDVLGIEVLRRSAK